MMTELVRPSEALGVDLAVEVAVVTASCFDIED